MTQLKKHWLRLCLSVNAINKIPLKIICKTFASGRNEKLVFQSFKDIDLPCEKTSDVDACQFTFKNFYNLFNMICPRFAQ